MDTDKPVMRRRYRMLATAGVGIVVAILGALLNVPPFTQQGVFIVGFSLGCTILFWND